MKRDVKPVAAALSVDEVFTEEKCLQANADERKQLSKKERPGSNAKVARAI